MDGLLCSLFFIFIFVIIAFHAMDMADKNQEIEMYKNMLEQCEKKEE